jgi:hypothetical protein
MDSRDWWFYGRILLLILLILLAFIILEQPQPGPEYLKEMQTHYEDEAIKNNDDTICENLKKIPGTSVEDCYWEYAYQRQDFSVCEKAGSMEYDCYLALAAGNENQTPYLAPCLRVEQGLTRDNCILVYVINTNSSSSCKLIDDSDMETYCMAMVRGDASKCAEIADEFRQEKCLECFEKGSCYLSAKKYLGYYRWW